MLKQWVTITSLMEGFSVVLGKYDGTNGRLLSYYLKLPR